MNTAALNAGILLVTALCACAPTSTTETPVTLGRPISISCAAALKAVQGASLRISPGDTWLPYRTESATQNSVVLQASSRLLPTTRTTSVWTCTQTVDAFTATSAVITVSTLGLPSDVAQNIHLAFFAALNGQ